MINGLISQRNLAADELGVHKVVLVFKQVVIWNVSGLISVFSPNFGFPTCLLPKSALIDPSHWPTSLMKRMRERRTRVHFSIVLHQRWRSMTSRAIHLLPILISFLQMVGHHRSALLFNLGA